VRVEEDGQHTQKSLKNLNFQAALRTSFVLGFCTARNVERVDFRAARCSKS
jgi:hypothetical protein